MIAMMKIYLFLIFDRLIDIKICVCKVPLLKVDYEEKAPLHFAAANGLGDVVKLLVDNKADVAVQV